MQTVTYKQTDDATIRADVYGSDLAAPPKPAIVFIHGGALMMGSRSGRTVMHDRWLGDGYVVISIDYRLAPETKLPAIIEDLRGAFRWVREEGRALLNIDPKRIGVVGNSAGGYLTLMAGCCVAPRPRALVSFYGYGDLIGDWYSKPDPFYCTFPIVKEEDARATVGKEILTGEHGDKGERGQFYLYCRQRGIWPYEVSGFDPRKQPEAFSPYCPVQQVTPDYPPTLLLHGDADTDVPYAQSVMMAAALVEAGVEHELITIPGGPHGFDYEPNDPVVANALNRAQEFMRNHL